ncbi:M24 family metallopeptidase [Halobacteriaceae archaeon GCM10025711]
MDSRPLRLPDSEYETRVERVRDRLAADGFDALCLFGATSIEWLTGFHHLQTERPVCLAVTDETVEIAVPRLERDRARNDAFPVLETVHHYYDYPGDGDGNFYEHPARTPEATIAGMLDGLDVARVAADADGAPGTWGYSGPSLAEAAGVEVATVDWITEWRKTKSAAELDLLRESGRWTNLAHRRLAEAVAPGRHELRVSTEASLDASMAMLDALGDRYDSRLRGELPARAMFLSGPNTALPHGLTANRRLEEGDVLVTGASADVAGYGVELERTMFVGTPTDSQQHYFEVMLEAQTVGLEACGPGVPLADVDQAVHDYLDEQGVLEYAQHHTGHNLGLEGHEPDYIDRGSEAVMEPGHVYSIEPGIYVPGEGGFRHSDTVAITEDGVEPLTYYPRTLAENVIPI